MNHALASLHTEQPSPASQRLDTCNALEIVRLMNEADRTVPEAVSNVLPQIAKATDIIVEALSRGGRLFYMGAGTSGRLGVLDAAECPPTFSTPPAMVQALIAGGMGALFEAVEAAEDSPKLGADDLRNVQLSNLDVVVGIAASGRTPYVRGGLEYARSMGAKAISISCNADAEISGFADVAIEVETGPEILMGSTRLKAGTAQKLVLNMLSTASMVRLGKVYQNYMVDLKATNDKLVERSKRIIMYAAGVSYDSAADALQQADGNVKTAIVIVKKQVNKSMAERLLTEANGFLRAALGE